MRYCSIGAIFGLAVAASCATASYAHPSATYNAITTKRICCTLSIPFRIGFPFLRNGKKLSYFDRHSASDGGLARPLHGLVHVGTLQQPHTADMLLGLEIRPIADDDLSAGLLTYRFRLSGRLQTTSKIPDSGSDHLPV